MVESGSVTKIDKEIHAKLNEIRANPSMLLPILEDIITRFDGKILQRLGDLPHLMT